MLRARSTSVGSTLQAAAADRSAEAISRVDVQGEHGCALAAVRGACRTEPSVHLDAALSCACSPGAADEATETSREVSSSLDVELLSPSISTVFSKTFVNAYPANGYYSTACRRDNVGVPLYRVDATVRLGNVTESSVEVQTIELSYSSMKAGTEIFVTDVVLADQRTRSLTAIDMGSYGLWPMFYGGTQVLRVNRTFERVDAGAPLSLTIYSASETRLPGAVPATRAERTPSVRPRATATSAIPVTW